MPFDDFDLQIQCEEVYEENPKEIYCEDLYEMSEEMQRAFDDWFFTHLDEIEEEVRHD